ncbi:hypothetical protein ABZU25_19465 [Micromonospora sp. NPDC005215]
MFKIGDRSGQRRVGGSAQQQISAGEDIGAAVLAKIMPLTS